MTLNLLEGSSLTAARFKTTGHRVCYIVLKLLLTQSQLVTWKINNSYHSIASKAFLITIPSKDTSLTKPPRAPPFIFYLIYLILLIVPKYFRLSFHTSSFAFWLPFSYIYSAFDQFYSMLVDAVAVKSLALYRVVLPVECTTRNIRAW